MSSARATSKPVANAVPRLDAQLCFALYSAGLAMNKVYRKLLKALDAEKLFTDCLFVGPWRGRRHREENSRNETVQ